MKTNRKRLKDPVEIKAGELRLALGSLGERLEAGDDSDLLIWVLPNALACAHRPLRHDPEFHGGGVDLPPHAAPALLQWIHRMKAAYKIRAIISLMHPKELQHYSALNFGASDLLELYRKEGFSVCHIPWDDPAHRPFSERATFPDELNRIRIEALHAFDILPRPVLLHCSAGIDRSSPVAAYIFDLRRAVYSSQVDTPAY